MVGLRLLGVAAVYVILLYYIIGFRKLYWNNYIKNSNISCQKILTILMLIIFIVKILLIFYFFILVSKSGFGIIILFIII